MSASGVLPHPAFSPHAITDLLQGAHLCIQAYPECVRIFAVTGDSVVTGNFVAQGRRHFEIHVTKPVVGLAQCVNSLMSAPFCQSHYVEKMLHIAETVASESEQPSLAELQQRGAQVPAPHHDASCSCGNGSGVSPVFDGRPQLQCNLLIT